jgi:hypothetical protein
MRTSFHHQPEAQHPHKYAGRLPHLLAQSGHYYRARECPLLMEKQTLGKSATDDHTRNSARQACFD